MQAVQQSYELPRIEIIQEDYEESLRQREILLKLVRDLTEQKELLAEKSRAMMNQVEKINHANVKLEVEVEVQKKSLSRMKKVAIAAGTFALCTLGILALIIFL